MRRKNILGTYYVLYNLHSVPQLIIQPADEVDIIIITILIIIISISQTRKPEAQKEQLGSIVMEGAELGFQSMPVKF